jgi:hypothetical protein
MEKVTWEEELKRFEGLRSSEKMLWLVALQFSLTLLARDTYDPGLSAVTDPSTLRKVNEFFHRLSNYQLKLLDPSIGAMSAADAVNMIEESRKEIGVEGEFLLRSMYLPKDIQ